MMSNVFYTNPFRLTYSSNDWINVTPGTSTTTIQELIDTTIYIDLINGYTMSIRVPVAMTVGRKLEIQDIIKAHFDGEWGLYFDYDIRIMRSSDTINHYVNKIKALVQAQL